MDKSICLRCNGKVLRDLAGEEACVTCGGEAVYSIPLTATPNNFYASLPPVTTKRRGAKLKGSSNKQVRGSRSTEMKEYRAKRLQVREEEGTTPVNPLQDAA